MITDRTQLDVNKSKSIIEQKVKKFIELTNDDKNTLERGTVTINTINRIENKQAEIMQTLNDMGYYVSIINKSWSLGDAFKQADLERIAANNIALRSAFYAFKDSPVNAIAKYHYSEFNRLEKILIDIFNNIEYTISRYRRCGNFNCGG